MPFYSPLRYPGGKRKLANFIKLVLKKNSLCEVHYAEPYGGGAAIALSLLYEGYAKHIHINDMSRPVYAFWYSAINHTEEFCNRIKKIKVTLKEWYKQREILDNQKEVPLLDLGFSTFFLNRTNRSGIITGGIIGGKNQNGNYKIDARFTKDELIRRIKQIGEHRKQISIYNKDAIDFIRNDIRKIPPNSFVFLDPPYYVKGKELYENFYLPHNHIEVANIVSKINQNWVVTYDNVPQILALYANYRHIVYKLSYSATDRYQGSELMFFCDKMKIPTITTTEPLNNERVRVN